MNLKIYTNYFKNLLISYHLLFIYIYNCILISSSIIINFYADH